METLKITLQFVKIFKWLFNGEWPINFLRCGRDRYIIWRDTFEFQFHCKISYGQKSKMRRRRRVVANLVRFCRDMGYPESAIIKLGGRILSVAEERIFRLVPG